MEKGKLLRNRAVTASIFVQDAGVCKDRWGFEQETGARGAKRTKKRVYKGRGDIV